MQLAKFIADVATGEVELPADEIERCKVIGFCNCYKKEYEKIGIKYNFNHIKLSIKYLKDMHNER